MMRVFYLLLFVGLLATACSTPKARFNEQAQADLIVRYYTDDTSYVLKPAKTDGRFLGVLKKGAVLDVAKEQPGRQLAVVILIHYRAAPEGAKVKAEWTKLLTDLGYQRVVFLLAQGSMQVDGLTVLPPNEAGGKP
jgi:hypothetical protein